jgi:DNA polymerase (family 10)
VENLEIAAALKEFGDLLEIKGSNPFRIRAYRNAVRTINDLTRPLAVMVEAGEDLTVLPGIGKEMASHIQELVEWGELSALEELGEEVPRTLTDLIRLDGVGPKKAKTLWEELEITSVDELEEALEADRIAGLPGFGKKSADKIFRSIEDFRKHQGRFLLSEADVLIRPLLRYMEGHPKVQRIEVAGSYRRRQETVGDIDILVQCQEDRGDVMEAFRSYPGAVSVDSAGETKGRIVLRSGLPVDLRILPEESYGAALHYFSGSKEHNVAIRTLGVKKGLRISEYGVFSGEETDSSNGERLGGEDEEDIFQAVDLPWISPLLRENRGELEAAAVGHLPERLILEQIRGDLQMHSTWSDGANTLREMAEACRDRGYEYFSITDHSQAVTVAGGLKPDQVFEQWEEVEVVRQSVEGIHLFRSLEVDILKDGSLDMPDEVLAGLDLVLVSVHSFMNMSLTEMTDRVIRALEHPEVDILAHPTGRILNRREPFALDVDAILQAAADLGVAVELNAHPSRLDLHDRYLRRAKELGVKVAVSTDAHSTQDLDLMSYGVDQACRGWLEAGDILNAMPLDDFLSWMNRKRIT